MFFLKIYYEPCAVADLLVISFLLISVICGLIFFTKMCDHLFNSSSNFFCIFFDFKIDSPIKKLYTPASFITILYPEIF